MLPIERRDECGVIYIYWEASFPSLRVLEDAIAIAFPGVKAEDVLVFAVPTLLWGVVHACRKDRFDAEALSAETAEIKTLAQLQEEAGGRNHNLLIVESDDKYGFGESYRIILKEIAPRPQIADLIRGCFNPPRLAHAA